MSWWANALFGYKIKKDTGWRCREKDIIFGIFGVSIVSDFKIKTAFVVVVGTIGLKR